MEEVGPLGTAAGCCYVMPSIVGEAINTFGTEDQKQSYLVPMLAGHKVAAEALTEPRGGSDFFGASPRAGRILTLSRLRTVRPGSSTASGTCRSKFSPKARRSASAATSRSRSLASAGCVFRSSLSRSLR